MKTEKQLMNFSLKFLIIGHIFLIITLLTIHIWSGIENDKKWEEYKSSREDIDYRIVVIEEGEWFYMDTSCILYPRDGCPKYVYLKDIIDTIERINKDNIVKNINNSNLHIIGNNPNTQARVII